MQSVYQNTIDYDTAPTISGIPDQTLSESGSKNVDLFQYTSDPESTDTELTFSISQNSNPSCISASIISDRYTRITSVGTGCSCYVTTEVSDGIKTDTDGFSISVQSSTIDVTVTTNPAVEYITVDGSSYSPPHIFTWTAGSSHNISTPSPQYNSAGTIRYTFANWSDGGSQTHSVSPSTNTTFTAMFTSQYLLSTNVSPIGAGSVSGEGWYNPNTVVNLIATANSGYEFASWTGDTTGTSPTTSIVINGPKSVISNFRPVDTTPRTQNPMTW